METKILILIFLVLQNVSPIVESAFICNGISDSVLQLYSHENLEEKIRAMEEQILELQRLTAAGFGNVTSLQKDTLPTGKMSLRKMDTYARTAKADVYNDKTRYNDNWNRTNPQLKMKRIIGEVKEDYCAEIYDSGVKSDGIYLISPDGRCPFRVFCDMMNGGWTVIQRRMNGKVNFYRPWDEYVQGFGKLDGEHWLGLDRIHRLTMVGTQVFLYMENYDGSFEHAHYKAFTVHDVTTAYRMNVDPFSYEGSIKELFSFHNDMKFSTYDRDNDKNSGNCCQSNDGGGWWYNSCYRFNPNGVYGKQTNGGVGYYDKKDILVKNFLIKIKRRHGLC